VFDASGHFVAYSFNDEGQTDSVQFSNTGSAPAAYFILVKPAFGTSPSNASYTLSLSN
jgi:hypothetical protein